MRLAIISRSGPCFPNIISQGLAGLLDDLGVENEIIYDGIPFLMRLLPLSRKPKRWHNNLQFRIRNKLASYSKDRALIKKLNSYDGIIISECYPNAFWRNYFAIGELRKVYPGRIISYTESPIDAAPLNKMRLMDRDDYDESIYDFNLFVTDSMEVKRKLNNRQAVAGVNISAGKELNMEKKGEFVAVVDFAQAGYDVYRQQQLDALRELGIKTIVLEGRYPVQEIRSIYRQAAVFFLSFPETFGLPIAECLACGAYIFSPSSSWPMSWRLNEQPMPMAQGLLPDCFRIYEGPEDLKAKLEGLIRVYDPQRTPDLVFNTFLKHYDRFFHGNKKGVQYILDQFN